MAIQGIGSPVSKNVADQIAARKRVIEKQTGKTAEDLLYLNSKTGWIKLSSSVNTLSEQEVEQLRGGTDPIMIKGDNLTAASNILLGGVLNPEASLRSGIDSIATNTAAEGVLSYYAYQNRANSSGIRPMPGITSMNVKSKNTYGTLREAEVKFICWTLEDFETMEQIYLRPGFSVLLEWGHSMYIDNNGKLIKEIETIGNKYFDSGITMSGILNDIADIRTKSSYNYEGMIGYIKNFSWNYTKEGAYDCSVSIISTGEILESLQLRFDPQLRIPAENFSSTFWDAGKEQRKSIFHYFIQKMAGIHLPTFNKKIFKLYAGDVVDQLEDFTGYYHNIQVDDCWYWDTDTNAQWIPLRTFFDIFNKFASPVDRTKAEGTVDRTLTRFNTDYEHSSKFLTSDQHFSADPLVCVLPKPADLTVSWWWGLFGDKVEKIAVSPMHDDDAPALPEGSTADDVLNILVCVPYIKGVLDAALDKDGKLEKSMFDITETILGGINTALGGINDLGLAFNEELNGGTWHVVDRNNTPTEKIAEMPVFTLAGIGSVFTDVSISSKISNEIGSQISIAAQSTARNTSENISNILKWNPNVIDRLKVIKSDDPEPEEESAEEALEKEKERINDWLQDVVDLFNQFDSGDGYDTELMETVKTTHAEWTNNNVAQRNRIQNKQPLPGLVPVELSFKTDGIGGFKIAESFKIAPGILPSKYQDRFGYIITGLEHSIGGDNRWETSIRTQFFGIDIPDEQLPEGTNTNKPKGGNSGNNKTPNGGYSATKGGTSRVIEGVTYKNGEMPDSKLRYINNWKHYMGANDSDNKRLRLYDKASRALDTLLAAAEANMENGKKAPIIFRINSAYRTIPDQVRIKKQYGSDAATPGKSNHGFGLAVDFATPPATQLTPSTKQYKWLKENASKYGFARLPWGGKGEAWEAWHWEYQI